MTEIEKRAVERVGIRANWGGTIMDAYIEGATEQKAIDIDKALEWIKSNLDSDEGGEIELCFRKAMEE